jgi:hypothetical protein
MEYTLKMSYILHSIRLPLLYPFVGFRDRRASRRNGKRHHHSRKRHHHKGIQGTDEIDAPLPSGLLGSVEYPPSCDCPALSILLWKCV